MRLPNWIKAGLLGAGLLVAAESYSIVKTLGGVGSGTVTGTTIPNLPAATALASGDQFVDYSALDAQAEAPTLAQLTTYFNSNLTFPSGSTGANPTATVGTSAVNGSATTYMRSDGAPAIDLTMAPVWTGNHEWSKTEPRLLFNQAGAAADVGLWDLDLASSNLCLRTRTDADGAGQNAICANRNTTTTLTGLTFGNATTNLSYTFVGSGATSFSGSVSVSRLVATGSSLPANGVYLPSANTLGLTANSAAIGSFSQTAVSLGNATNNPTFTWLGTGGSTFGGSIATSNFIQGGRLIPSTATIGSCAACITLPAANSLGFNTNSVAVGNFDSAGTLNINVGFVSKGTKFTASGCSNSATVGGAVAGQFASGTTGTCTVTVTLPTAPNGWACHADDLTTPANFIGQSATSTTSCTVQGTTVSGDVIVFSAMGF